MYTTVKPASLGPWLGFLSILNILVFLALIGIMIYGLILLIKLARLGIKALGIYIEKNK